MSKFNYCYDECEHNTCKRHYWSEKVEDKVVRRGKSEESNKPLKCNLGYVQTINSHQALVNSKKNKARICNHLIKLFEGGQDERI